MSRAIAAVLREAAKNKYIPDVLDAAIPYGPDGSGAYWFAHNMRDLGYFGNLTNQERSAFLYLCSLLAEDEE